MNKKAAAAAAIALSAAAATDVLRRRIALDQRATNDRLGRMHRTAPKLDPIWVDILSCGTMNDSAKLAAPQTNEYHLPL